MLKIIESKDEHDETLTEENNLHKARIADKEYEIKIASTTKTNAALCKKNIVQGLIEEILYYRKIYQRNALLLQTEQKQSFD